MILSISSLSFTSIYCLLSFIDFHWFAISLRFDINKYKRTVIYSINEEMLTKHNLTKLLNDYLVQNLSN